MKRETGNKWMTGVETMKGENRMKKGLKMFTATMALTMAFSGMAMTSYAGSWQEDSTGHWYQNDDGSYPASTWQWIDGNGDEIAECYYFDENGYCLLDTVTPDNYQVDASGAWVKDGMVQIQTAEASASEDETKVAEDVILDVNNLSEEQKNMFEVMDSLGYYMCNPMLTNLDYEPQDSEFFWGAMWRLILLYAPNVNDGTGRMTRTEDWSLAVDESLIEEYATALFADYNGIPALPEMYGITRTADDVYTFGPGDRALDYGKLVSWTEHSDGTSTVVTQLLNEMDVEPYGEYEFTLVKNQYADQFENPRYLYSVADVKER